MPCFDWGIGPRVTNTMATGKYRELQRLTVQYARMLDLNLEEASVDAESMDVE